MRLLLGNCSAEPFPPMNQIAETMAALAYKWLASTALIFALVLIAGIWHMGSNSMIACGFFGACFIFIGTRPGRKLLLINIAAGAAYAGAYKLLGGPFDHDPLIAVIGAGAFLGIGSITVMAWQLTWQAGSNQAAALRDALVLPVFSLVAGLGMNWVNGEAQRTYDHLLYAFDGTLLRVPPGQTVTALFASFPWIAAASSAAYQGLLIFPPLYRGWALHRGVRGGVNVMHAFAVAGIAGFILYQVCPAEGPVYSFGTRFPNHLPDWHEVSLAPYLSAGVHNAIPSMHMAWALLVLWSALELGPLALTIATTFAGFTALATLGSGEHYLIDLVVSAPLILAVVSAFKRDLARTALGLVLTFGWLAYLRGGAFLPRPGVANWMLIAATFVIVIASQLHQIKLLVVQQRVGLHQHGPAQDFLDLLK
jgi:PAP2 superfamily